MHELWYYDNVRVIGTGASFTPDPSFTGIAVDKFGTVWTWHAIPIPQGYDILMRNRGGSLKKYTGCTFNLGLEVATCLRN